MSRPAVDSRESGQALSSAIRSKVTSSSNPHAHVVTASSSLEAPGRNSPGELRFFIPRVVPGAGPSPRRPLEPTRYPHNQYERCPRVISRGFPLRPQEPLEPLSHDHHAPRLGTGARSVSLVCLPQLRNRALRCQRSPLANSCTLKESPIVPSHPERLPLARTPLRAIRRPT